MSDRSSLVLDALAFFQDWLCGVGLTSPGMLLEGKALRDELDKIEVVKRKVHLAILSTVKLAPASAPAGWSNPDFRDDLAAELLLLDKKDRQLMRAAIELYLEEAESLAMFFTPSVNPDDLRVLLDQVRNEVGETRKHCSERSGAKDCRERHGPEGEEIASSETSDERLLFAKLGKH